MNSLTKYWVLTAVAALGLVGSAQASTLQFIVTDAQIEAANPTFGGNCATLSACGIYGVGFVSDNTHAATSGVAISNTVGTSTDQWVSFGLNSGAAPGFEAGDAGATIAFITTNTALSTSSALYTTSTGGTLLKAAAANTASLSTGTSSGELLTSTGFTFDVNYSGAIAPGTDSITLELAAEQLNSDGTVGSQKTLLGQITLNETLTATPEPSSIVLMFGGLLAMAAPRLRRLRRSQA